MEQPENPFGVAADKIAPDTREDRIKRHGLDPKDTAYRSHKYGPPIGMPKPCSPEFVAAQRRIEAIIQRVRGDHPELDFREAWTEAARQLGIDLAAVAP